MQVCIEIVGYLLEELRDNKNYEQFKKDMADANIFIGSLIFIEELAEKVTLHIFLLLHTAFAHQKTTCFKIEFTAACP